MRYLMDINALLTTLWASQSPVLPQPTLMDWAQRLMWAVVLASGALLIAGRLERPYRLTLGWLLLLWTLWPGPAAPAYWLGLAFQSPSLMSVAVCLAWLVRGGLVGWQGATSGAGVGRVALETRTAVTVLSVLGVVLGWVLLMDTLGWLPFSLYHWGFGAGACYAVILLAGLLWLLLGSLESALPLVAVGLFVLTRLPSGNVWDALIDPLLWIALQLSWLLNALRWRRARRRLPTATRA